jgi:Amt family ammonium transporter
LIGIISAIVCYLAVALKNKLKFDDALDVWGVHGVGGVVGCISLGIFATLAVNKNGAAGLLFGNSIFFLKEIAVVLGVALYAFVFSYAMLWLIDKITPVRTSPDHEDDGLDFSLHGETAYE